MEPNASRGTLVALASAVAVMLFPGELWGSVGVVGGADFGAVDRAIGVATKFSGPLFLASGIGAFVTYGMSRTDEGMKKFFNGTLGAAGMAGVTKLGAYLGIGGAVL